MKRLVLSPCALLLLACAVPATAETTLCVNITAVPVTISAPGVYCLKQDLQTSIATGHAITVDANSVTIDFNGYRLGGLGAGPATQTNGVFVSERKNVTIRNANIRGFRVGIYVNGSDGGPSSGHLIENNLVDANTWIGLFASGSGVVVRNNRVINTGPAPGATLGYAIYGIFLTESLIEGNEVSDTEANDASRAIDIVSSSDVSISSNTLANTKSNDASAAGIHTTLSNRINIVDNTITRTTSSAPSGIKLFRTDDVIVSTNTIQNVSGASSTGILNDITNLVVCRENRIIDALDGTELCTVESGTIYIP